MAQTWIGGESKPTLKLDGKKVITKWLNITDENTVFIAEVYQRKVNRGLNILIQPKSLQAKATKN